MSLPKRNSADGRCYWMKPEVQEELQPLFDQCIQDAIDGRITRLDSLWPPVVVSSEGAPFEVWQLLRTWTEAQRAETLDAEKAIAFSENLRRQSRWGEIDHHLLDMLKRELQEKYFVVTGNEDDHFWDREYSLKPDIRAEEVPEPLLRFACYVAVSYKVYGMDFQYLPFGGWNECPNTPELMAVAKYWFEQHGAVPAAMSHDELEFTLPAPVPEEKAMGTAVEQYGFCPDVVDQEEDPTVGNLADVLRQSTVWYFWWD